MSVSENEQLENLLNLPKTNVKEIITLGGEYIRKFKNVNPKVLAGILLYEVGNHVIIFHNSKFSDIDNLTALANSQPKLNVQTHKRIVDMLIKVINNLTDISHETFMSLQLYKSKMKKMLDRVHSLEDTGNTQAGNVLMDFISRITEFGNPKILNSFLDEAKLDMFTKVIIVEEFGKMKQIMNWDSTENNSQDMMSQKILQLEKQLTGKFCEVSDMRKKCQNEKSRLEENFEKIRATLLQKIDATQKESERDNIAMLDLKKDFERGIEENANLTCKLEDSEAGYAILENRVTNMKETIIMLQSDLEIKELQFGKLDVEKIHKLEGEIENITESIMSAVKLSCGSEEALNLGGFLQQTEHLQRILDTLKSKACPKRIALTQSKKDLFDWRKNGIIDRLKSGDCRNLKSTFIELLEEFKVQSDIVTADELVMSRSTFMRMSMLNLKTRQSLFELAFAVNDLNLILSLFEKYQVQFKSAKPEGGNSNTSSSNKPQLDQKWSTLSSTILLGMRSLEHNVDYQIITGIENVQILIS